ncbi:protein hunchback isoform X3 [Lingula anatina]|uniref:Protein hunchback isoform X3 n=1 Tax=Lingula anatina TaxID=7574 RepID=A0A1S3KDU1_LINAN|nr:protein hunchback isoform X3 [Lingula anatina]|eukprot:XP_013420662.1 protein hunchback isoform X3 [Lingula anatina]
MIANDWLPRRDALLEARWAIFPPPVMSVATANPESTSHYIDNNLGHPQTATQQNGYNEASSIKQLLTNHIRRDLTNQTAGGLESQHIQQTTAHRNLGEVNGEAQFPIDAKLTASQILRDQPVYASRELIESKLARSSLSPPHTQPPLHHQQPSPTQLPRLVPHLLSPPLGPTAIPEGQIPLSPVQQPSLSDLQLRPPKQPEPSDLKQFDVPEEALPDEKAKEDLISQIVESQLASHRYRDHAAFASQLVTPPQIAGDSGGPIGESPVKNPETAEAPASPSLSQSVAETKDETTISPTTSTVVDQQPLQDKEMPQDNQTLPQGQGQGQVHDLSPPLSNTSVQEAAAAPQQPLTPGGVVSPSTSQFQSPDHSLHSGMVPSPSKSDGQLVIDMNQSGGDFNRSNASIASDDLSDNEGYVSQYTPIMPGDAGDHGSNDGFVYHCHLCSYSGTSRFHFNAHMNSHFEHQCPHCDYTSRTEGRLKRHIKDFHSSVPPDNYSGNRMLRTVQNRPKLYRCKQCEFVAQTKIDFWEHARTHIKDDKILQCPKCPFVTEYKHHLEYHLRNHFGSKPFKCLKCNYSCVNKSMLNSHMKSHTNIYQYRCNDCSYASKYCHSLKLHLRKYNHKPATILNIDGTPMEDGETFPPRRGPPRGPRGPRKEKQGPSNQNMPLMLNPQLAGLVRPPFPGGQQMMNGMMPFWPMMPGHMAPNGMPMAPQGIPLHMAQKLPPGMIPMPGMPGMPPQLHPQQQQQQQHPMVKQEPGVIQCGICEFTTESQSDLSTHMLKVHAAENQDLFSAFGLNSDSFTAEQARQEKAGLLPPAAHSKHSPQGAAPYSQVKPPQLPQMSPGMMQHSAMPPKASPSQMWMMNGGRPPMRPQVTSAPTAGAGVLDLSGKLVTGDRQGEPNTSGATARPRSGHGSEEAPLDLSAPNAAPPGRQEYYNAYMPIAGRKRPIQLVKASDGEYVQVDRFQNGEAEPESVPRKRSRKGKAFKLDKLCLKLQERATDSPNSYGSNEDYSSDGYVEDNTQDGASAESPPNISKPVAEGDLNEIHNSLRQLNSESPVENNLQNQYVKVYHDGEENSMQSSGNMKSEQNSDEMDRSSLQNGYTGEANDDEVGEGIDSGRYNYECPYCDILFADCVMFTMHMGYHGYSDPYKCNMCGFEGKDKVEFFMHIARNAHEEQENQNETE